MANRRRRFGEIVGTVKGKNVFVLIEPRHSLTVYYELHQLEALAIGTSVSLRTLLLRE